MRRCFQPEQIELIRSHGPAKVTIGDNAGHMAITPLCPNHSGSVSRLRHGLQHFWDGSVPRHSWSAALVDEFLQGPSEFLPQRSCWMVFGKIVWLEA